MYLPFGKLCKKLLDIKYIILNSPLISRMNSIKLIVKDQNFTRRLIP